MNGFKPLYRKELAAIFYSPMAYAVMTLFMVLMGYTFCAQLFLVRSASLVALLLQAAVLFVLMIPLLTMRQFAEERRRGTLELLLSAPVDDLAVVLAKFCADLTVVVLMLGLMLTIPGVLAFFVTPDWGPVVSGTVGLLLLSATLVAFGLAVSAFTTHQLIAAIVSLGLFLMMWMVESVGMLLPAPFDQIAIALSLDNRLTPFVTGTVYLSDVGFFLSLTLAGLSLSVAGLARR